MLEPKGFKREIKEICGFSYTDVLEGLFIRIEKLELFVFLFVVATVVRRLVRLLAFFVAVFRVVC